MASALDRNSHGFVLWSLWMGLWAMDIPLCRFKIGHFRRYASAACGHGLEDRLDSLFLSPWDSIRDISFSLPRPSPTFFTPSVFSSRLSGAWISALGSPFGSYLVRLPDNWRF
ncbi:hypothetical protein M405DRAFT_814561 [Rhizopogon salebrosus TDB-379]|nr:hypothetical protein M405DRAFT_814561 [Rhizopogon salebrosus TDB-379]